MTAQHSTWQHNTLAINFNTYSNDTSHLHASQTFCTIMHLLIDVNINMSAFMIVGVSKNPRKKKQIFHTRLGQLIQWCTGGGKASNTCIDALSDTDSGTTDILGDIPTDATAVFQGCVLFDECHRAKKFYNGAHGKPSQSGKAVHALQQSLPGARVVYCSATGISQPSNMGYMSRLGLWGKGTAFIDFPAFLDAVERGGIGMSELVAMHLRRTGGYLCRTLSFATCSFETIETGAAIQENDKENDKEKEGREGEGEMSFDFQGVFDEAAALWQAIYRELVNGLTEDRFEYNVAKAKGQVKGRGKSSRAYAEESDDDDEDMEEWMYLENRGVKPLSLPPGECVDRMLLRYPSPSI